MLLTIPEHPKWTEIQYSFERRESTEIQSLSRRRHQLCNSWWENSTLNITRPPAITLKPSKTSAPKNAAPGVLKNWDRNDRAGLQYLLKSKKQSGEVWRVIGKIRKTQHQNPDFGHTQGEIRKKPAKKYISIQGGMKLRKPSIFVVNCVPSHLSFFRSASTAATYIFSAPNCTTTIISLEPCALNGEFSISYLKYLYFADTNERGDRGWKEAQRQGEDRVILRITHVTAGSAFGFMTTSLNPVPNAQVCVYLTVHITKLQVQTTFPKPFYIAHC